MTSDIENLPARHPPSKPKVTSSVIRKRVIAGSGSQHQAPVSTTAQESAAPDSATDADLDRSVSDLPIQAAETSRDDAGAGSGSASTDFSRADDAGADTDFSRSSDSGADTDFSRASDFGDTDTDTDYSSAELASLFDDLAALRGEDQAQAARLRVEPLPYAPRPPAPRPRRRRWPLALAVLAVALLLGLAVLIRLGTSQPAHKHVAAVAPTATAAGASASARPATSPTTARRLELVSWARGALSSQSVIVSDAGTAHALRRAGFTSSIQYADLGTRSLDAVDYVADISALAPPSTARARSGYLQAVGRSLPLALFGQGGSTATVREVFPDGIVAAQRLNAEETAVRRAGGGELARNPGVLADARVHKLLLDGQLDERAQSLLAMLAVTQRVRVTDPVLIPAEQRIGQPVRSMVITTTDGSAAQDVISSLLVPYRPDSVHSISSRTWQVSWRPAIAPVRSVGG